MGSSTPCDPGLELGPFEVSDGGKLLARLTGNPAAPRIWSGYNVGTSLRIVYEPLMGAGHYGAAQEILAFFIPAEQTAAEMGASWPGPGRLRAYTGAASGGGPLNGSCFEQSYTATAEIVEVAASSRLQPGMALCNGDTIVTGDGAGEVLVAGSTTQVAAGSAVTVNFTEPSGQQGTGTGTGAGTATGTGTGTGTGTFRPPLKGASARGLPGPGREAPQSGGSGSIRRAEKQGPGDLWQGQWCGQR